MTCLANERGIEATWVVCAHCAIVANVYRVDGEGLQQYRLKEAQFQAVGQVQQPDQQDEGSRSRGE